MKVSIVMSALVLLSCAALAEAHAHLRKSNPADGSTLSASPPNIVLTFSEAARITAAWIQKNDGGKEKLGSLPEKLASQVTIGLPSLTAGTYVVSWRVVGDDGHVMPGQLRFTISSAGAAKVP